MASAPLTYSHVLFYGREYQEVLEMVALEEKSLAGKRILDCPSGPDAFVLEAHARGFDVTGCDPLYTKPLAEIVKQGDADIHYAWAECKKHPEALGGLDIDAFHRRKLAALGVFARDFAAGAAAGRYRAAALPELPFADKSFDLVISANLLFLYSSTRMGGLSGDETLDLDFHCKAVRELVRVCRGEVRIFPVMTHTEKKYLHPYAAQVIGQLAAEGLRMTFAESTYSQASADGHLVLIVDCAP